jgi:thioredoxin reductase
LAVIGAGPIGIETALAALERGFDVHLFERGEVAAHPRAWGHVRMFTPWRTTWSERGVAALQATGWQRPDPDECPTGNELAERYLEPLARLTALRERIHTGAQVVHVSRAGTRQNELLGKPERATRPFRLLVRDRGGRESFLHAFALVDASGTYGQPNWMGSGGIPARSEMALAAQLSYHPDDVLGLRRARYAGKRTLLVGAGHSAATTALALDQLAREAPGTSVVWATRKPAAALFPDDPADTLPARRRLHAEARSLLAGGSPAVTHVGGAEVEGLEFNSATHRYRVTLLQGEQPRVEEVHQIIANVGYGPDASLYRELQVHECYATRGLMKLSAALLEAGSADCTQVPSFGAETLVSPEPAFFVLGTKSYGRTPTFLLRTGYQQVEDALAELTRRLEVPARG